MQQTGNKIMNNSQVYQLVERQAKAWEAADVDAALADFAPNALFISPGGRWQGHAAIRTAIQAFFAEAGEVKVKITRVFVAGNQGAAEWTWSETRYADNSHHTAEDAIIFELQADKIVYWREYFDTANF